MSIVKVLLTILATIGGAVAYFLRKYTHPRPSVPPVAEKAVDKAKDIVKQVHQADVARALDVQEKVAAVEQKAEELKAKDSVDVANDIIAGL